MTLKKIHVRRITLLDIPGAVNMFKFVMSEKAVQGNRQDQQGKNNNQDIERLKIILIPVLPGGFFFFHYFHWFGKIYTIFTGQ